MPDMKFTVIDQNTGEYPDLEHIALHEDWAKGLMYCDMEGFLIGEDGALILADECGRFAYCPDGRFIIIPDAQRMEPVSEYTPTKEQVLEAISILKKSTNAKKISVNTGFTVLTASGILHFLDRIGEKLLKTENKEET